MKSLLEMNRDIEYTVYKIQQQHWNSQGNITELTTFIEDFIAVLLLQLEMSFI